MFDSEREAASLDAKSIREKGNHPVMASVIRFGEELADKLEEVDHLDLNSSAFTLQVLGASIGLESAKRMEGLDDNDPAMDKIVYANLMAASLIIAADSLFAKVSQ